MNLSARVLGVGLVGPGLAGWRESRPVLAGESPYVPAPTAIPSPESLPPTERRRAGKGVKLVLAAGLGACADAGREARELAAVFTSSSGDGENQHAICEVLASPEREISPTRFHNSVHNAPAGYWGIATGAMAPSDSLAAFDASFAAGLVEALGRLAADPSREVLVVAYDAPYPEPLKATRPIADAFGVGLVMGPASASEGGRLIEATFAREAPTTVAHAALESVRTGIPSARGLPLLQLLASGKPGRVVLEYLANLSLAIEVRA
jgi:hypothetical protein